MINAVPDRPMPDEPKVTQKMIEPVLHALKAYSEEYLQTKQDTSLDYAEKQEYLKDLKGQIIDLRIEIQDMALDGNLPIPQEINEGAFGLPF
jgi:hypothetical protein